MKNKKHNKTNLPKIFFQNIINKENKTTILVNKNNQEKLKSKIEIIIIANKKEKQNKKNVLLFDFKKLFIIPPKFIRNDLRFKSHQNKFLRPYHFLY